MIATTDHLATIRGVAAELGVLDAEDRLTELDSLTLVDFVVALEGALGVDLLGSEFQREDFQSIASIAALTARVGSRDLDHEVGA